MQTENDCNQLVSVIFPMFNVEDSVLNSLGTVQDQTYRNLEIICIDDGSTDKTLEYARSFAQDPRIKFITQANRGLGGARNAGLDAATGEWVTFVDSDDWIKPDMIRKLVEKAEAGNYDIVDCLHAVLSPVGDVTATRQHVIDENEADYYVKILAGRFPVQACARLYRRSLIADTRFPEKTLHEDLYVIYRLFHRAKRVGTVPEELYIWNGRDGSISRSSTRKHVDDIFGALDDAWEFLGTRNLRDELIGPFYQRCARLTLGILSKTSKYAPESHQAEVLDYLKSRVATSEYFSPRMWGYMRTQQQNLLKEFAAYPDFMTSPGVVAKPRAVETPAPDAAPKFAAAETREPSPFRHVLKKLLNRVRGTAQ